MITEPHPDGIDHYRKPDVGAWFDYPYNLSACLGYFQLFHSSTGARNDESYKAVDNSDMVFVNRNYGINNCWVLSDIVCYHLGGNGVNWIGCKSKRKDQTMRIDHVQALQQRAARVYPLIHMGLDRHIICKSCGLEMVVSSKQAADERMAKLAASITTTQTITTDGKQPLGVSQ